MAGSTDELLNSADQRDPHRGIHTGDPHWWIDVHTLYNFRQPIPQAPTFEPCPLSLEPPRCTNTIPRRLEDTPPPCRPLQSVRSRSPIFVRKDLPFAPRRAHPVAELGGGVADSGARPDGQKGLEDSDEARAQPRCGSGGKRSVSSLGP